MSRSPPAAIDPSTIGPRLHQMRQMSFSRIPLKYPIPLESCRGIAMNEDGASIPLRGGEYTGLGEWTPTMNLEPEQR